VCSSDLRLLLRASALGGLRLWSRGRFFVAGEDVYPRVIAA
jgi:hypothetical protein